MVLVDDAAPDRHVLVRVLLVRDRQRDARVAAQVVRPGAALGRVHDEVAVVGVDPDRVDLRPAALAQRRDVGDVGALDQFACLSGDLLGHRFSLLRVRTQVLLSPTRVSLLLLITVGLLSPLAHGSPSPDGHATAKDRRDPNPCLKRATRRQLYCPDLRMAPPAHMFLSRTRSGRLRLHAENSINSMGLGPAELRGRRATPLHDARAPGDLPPRRHEALARYRRAARLQGDPRPVPLLEVHPRRARSSCGGSARAAGARSASRSGRSSPTACATCSTATRSSRARRPASTTRDAARTSGASA